MPDKKTPPIYIAGLWIIGGLLLLLAALPLLESLKQAPAEREAVATE